jgi:hypothetical protein
LPTGAGPVHDNQLLTHNLLGILIEHALGSVGATTGLKGDDHLHRL